ncbi:MAG TPA: helix-turn-helix domain-containing protein, partial [Kiloniellaceae bacterium]
MPSEAAAPAFLTTREVAELLRVKERKVYDLAAAGDIPCRRVTGKLLFPRAEIEAWLARGSTAATSRVLPANIVAGSHDPLLDWAMRESGSGLAAY